MKMGTMWDLFKPSIPAVNSSQGAPAGTGGRMVQKMPGCCSANRSFCHRFTGQQRRSTRSTAQYREQAKLVNKEGEDQAFPLQLSLKYLLSHHRCQTTGMSSSDGAAAGGTNMCCAVQVYTQGTNQQHSAKPWP